MYQTILVPLENSPCDETILRHVEPLAKLTSARVYLIHVADGHVARNQKQLNLEDSEEIIQDRRYLEQRRDALASSGLTVHCHLALGDPAAEILRYAHEQRCDLIAMATHGHRFIKDTILGSVAHQVRHRTDIPVLMIRAEQR